MSVPSPQPTRFPAGVCTDWKYGVLADCGLPNPAFYHVLFDDFDVVDTNKWTVTNATTGTVAATAGDGGLALLTTAATNNDYESLQAKTAGFVIPASTGKKFFFLTRVKVSDIVNSTFFAGVGNAQGNPSSLTDGVYFESPAGGATLEITVIASSTAVTTAIPAAAYLLANATNVDLGFYIDRNGNLNCYVGAQLVGYQSQSGSGAVNSAGVSSLPVVGRCLQVATPTFPTANLAPFVALIAGAAAVKTMTCDFLYTSKER